MRILLINVGRKIEIRIPQGLLYLASAVQLAGHAVTIHDEALAENPQQSLEKILACDADIVGLSVYSVPWQLKRAEEISRAIKTTRKSALVVWGGWHPTLYPKHSILNENVDIVIRGPGERPLCQFLNALEQGQPLKNISRLVIKENGEIIESEPGPAAEYLYPPLNFELIDLNAYLRQHDAGAGILQYITSRGCNGRCRFCLMSRSFIKGRLIRKPKNQIISELQDLLQNPKIKSVHFSDDNAFRNDTEALGLCDIVSLTTRGKSIPWRCATRINTLSHLSHSTYEKLVACGCKGFVVGIESGVNRVLRLMRKGITELQTHRALNSMRDYELRTNLFFFLFDFPDETKSEALKTLTLARKTRLMFPDSDVALSVYFPGYSDTNWLPIDILPSLASRLSEFFEDYYAKHIRNYRLDGVNMRILRYYFGASKRRESNPAGKAGFLRYIYQNLILLRIKYGIFCLPFEYYLSNIVIERIRKVLARVKSNRNR